MKNVFFSQLNETRIFKNLTQINSQIRNLIIEILYKFRFFMNFNSKSSIGMSSHYTLMTIKANIIQIG